MGYPTRPSNVRVYQFRQPPGFSRLILPAGRTPRQRRASAIALGENPQTRRTLRCVNTLRSQAHPLSESIAPDAGKFLAVIDKVLVLNYLKPDLRRRVVKLQRRLIDAEMSAHYQARDE